MVSIPISFMIETLNLTEDGYLLCSTTSLPALIKTATGSFRVKLKYIQKAESLFIKLVGRASIIRSSFLNEIGSKQADDKTFIKVKIEEAYCFQKKSTSPYTSFLQSMNTFSMNSPLMGRAV